MLSIPTLGLECYTCANTGVSIFKQSFDVNEECESPKLGGDVPTEVCASGESCGMISGTINCMYINMYIYRQLYIKPHNLFYLIFRRNKMQGIKIIPIKAIIVVIC